MNKFLSLNIMLHLIYNNENISSNLSVKLKAIISEYKIACTGVLYVYMQLSGKLTLCRYDARNLCGWITSTRGGGGEQVHSALSYP
jgi:hypothetical protein